jgi:MFS family permease
MSLMTGVFLGYTISTALVWIIAIQMIRSIAYSCYEAPSLLYATELGVRQQRGRLASLYYAIGGLGSVAGSLVGGTLAEKFGLVPMYRGVVIFMILGIIVAGSRLPKLGRVTPEPVSGSTS